MNKQQILLGICPIYARHSSRHCRHHGKQDRESPCAHKVHIYFSEAYGHTKAPGTLGPLFVLCPEGRTAYPDAQPPLCALGIAAAVFSWIRRNRWQSHRGSGKAVDIRVSGKGWRHRAWCSGSSAARVETKCQCQLLSPEQQVRY